MPLDLDLGVDLDIIDEPPPSSAPTATDTGFLLHSVTVPANPQGLVTLHSAAEGRAAYPGEPALQAAIDAHYGAGGGGVLHVAPLLADEAASAAAFGANLGPGQLSAPEVNLAADIGTLRDWAWDNDRIYVAQAADGATQATLETLAAAVIDDQGGRFTMLEADRLLIPGLAAGTTREVGASVVEAAMMGRSDRNHPDNPGLAIAGNHTPGSGGQPSYVVGIKNERSITEQKALAQSQVNVFRTVNNVVRSYGYWTLADLDTLPQWWDMGGSRTIMAVRAKEQAVAEELMFGQVRADGAFLDRYKGALSSELAALQRGGALYGTLDVLGYNVDVASTVNPLSQQAQGKITATITVRTSPFAAELKITLTRKAINDQAA